MAHFPARIGLTALFAASLASCSVELQHDLAEDDANDIYVLLRKNGIAATKVREETGNEPRYIISVPKKDVAAAAERMREFSLPRPKADGLSIFKKTKGMIANEIEQRAMFLEALGGEVSNTLNRVPGVLEARAIVMLPEVNDLTQPEHRPSPSASVFLKYRAKEPLPLTEEQVRAFVATALPEMKSENVTVLMTPSQTGEQEISSDLALEEVLFLELPKKSAFAFKLIIGIAALLVLGMAGLTFWNFARTSRPRRARQPEA